MHTYQYVLRHTGRHEAARSFNGKTSWNVFTLYGCRNTTKESTVNLVRWPGERRLYIVPAGAAYVDLSLATDKFRRTLIVIRLICVDLGRALAEDSRASCWHWKVIQLTKVPDAAVEKSKSTNDSSLIGIRTLKLPFFLLTWTPI